MSIDRRLRAASHELREFDVPIAERAPRGSSANRPAAMLSIVMLVVGATLAVNGLDRTPASPAVTEAASIAIGVDDAATNSSETSAESSTPTATYDIDHELALIRQLRRSTRPDHRAVSAVPAPSIDDELALIRSLSRGSAPTSDQATDPSTVATPERAPNRPIVGLS